MSFPPTETEVRRRYTEFWLFMPTFLRDIIRDLERQGHVFIPTGSRIYTPDAVTVDSDWDVACLAEAVPARNDCIRKGSALGSYTITHDHKSLNFIACFHYQLTLWAETTRRMVWHIPQILHKPKRVEVFSHIYEHLLSQHCESCLDIPF